MKWYLVEVSPPSCPSSRRAWGWSRSSLGVSGSPLCCLKTMWSCWHPRTMTSGIHWGVLQLRPWRSAGHRWIAPSRWGQSACPKRRSSCTSGSCSRVRVRWSGRSTGRRTRSRIQAAEMNFLRRVARPPEINPLPPVIFAFAPDYNRSHLRFPTVFFY